MAIYARLENGTYAEVTGVYKADGTEVTEIFQGDRLVYSASNEIYGTVPLYYDGLGYDLTDYRISGSTVQDGTPSPDAPVDVVGCGVRTGNLARYWKAAYVNSIGVVSANNVNGMSYPVKIENGQTVSFSNQKTNFGRGFAVFRGFDGTDLSDMVYRTTNHSVVYTADEDCYAIIWGNYDNATSMDAEIFAMCGQMLNLGSEALPYEPYGYKLPLTVNGAEHPIYLGQVETTRRVKKLVLTGEEGWYRASTDSNRTACRLGRLMGTNAVGYCTHIYWKSSYEAQDYNRIVYINNYDNGSLYMSLENRLLSGQTVADFKSYLAAQYAAGTPVTVWYVLATPETAIVNEPLMKIGNYADTVSFAQAGVAIPTANGANALDTTSPVKPSEVYIKGKGIKPTGYGQLVDVNGVSILDKDGRPIYAHGQ